MAELVYAYVSEAYPARVESSSLSAPTENIRYTIYPHGKLETIFQR